MEKFRNLYRIPSARATWWDYAANGCYFITICTVNHECLLGRIMEDTSMQLSVIGEIIEEEWNKSFEIRKELFCDAFVIMPNHIHAVLCIENPLPVETHGVRLNTEYQNKERHCNKKQKEQDVHRTSLQGKSISSFVAGFKSSVTKRINEYYNTPGTRNTIWQTRFHDRIIRDKEEHQHIVNYIHENPIKWTEDKFYTP